MDNAPLRGPNELLGLSGISKRYYDSLVLDRVSLSVGRGELCAILGENGAGKTELMNIISGITKADGGQIWFEGSPVAISSPQRAFELGISMVGQEPQLVDALTVEQTIFLNREVTYHHLPFIRRRMQAEKAREVLRFLGWDISPNTLVRSLTAVERKLLLLARALCFRCRLLILDDITANFDPQDAARILRLVRRIHAQGISVLLITHKIEEVLVLCQHAVVLAEGRLIADYLPIDNKAAATLSQRMAGPDCRNRYPRTSAAKGRVLLCADRLCSAENRLNDISLYAREGEIVGIADLQEASKSALVGLLSGSVKPSSGALYIDSQPRRLRGPLDSYRAGLAVLRSGSANLYPRMDAYFNISISNLDDIGGRYCARPQDLRAFAMAYLRSVNLRKIIPSRPVVTLSYGTQQKLALSRAVCSHRSILILVDPTTGVDCAAKVDMYNMMNRMAHQGRAILLFSADMQEMAGMCDRVYVIYGNAIAAHFSGRDLTAHKLLACAAGNQARSGV